MIKNYLILLLISKTLDRLVGSKIFTKLDLIYIYIYITVFISIIAISRRRRSMRAIVLYNTPVTPYTRLPISTNLATRD